MLSTRSEPDLRGLTPETITRVELPNGITVLAYENRNSPAVVLWGYVWAGALNESPEQAGLSSFAAGTLMRGTESRTFEAINQALESVGARLNVNGGMHSAGFSGKALAEDLGLLLDILADALRHPTFPAAEVETLRGQILTALQRRAHDTRSMARLTFDALLYPGHPYGRSTRGYEATIAALSRDDLTDFYRRHYTPEGMVVTVVGAVSPTQAVDLVQTTLGNWQAPGVVPNRSIPPTVGLAGVRRESVPIGGKTQSDIALGWPGLTRNDPDYYAATLTNTVLGVFGMMGRLGDRVRDEQGLAYYVYSRLEAGLGAGPWLASAGVAPANVDRAVDGILAQVRRLRDEPVSVAELADCQSYLVGSMPLRLETNEGIALSIIDMERHQLGLDYLQRYADLIDSVTVAGVQEVARRYLDPDAYVLAVAGPPEP
jgi:zinc protease